MKRLHIMLAGSNQDDFAELAKTLQKIGIDSILQVTSEKELLESATEIPLDVLIVAEELQDSSGLACIRNFVKRYPNVNCALVSPLYAQEFHEETEGLGLFMQLPPKPGVQITLELLERLRHIHQLSGTPDNQA